MGYVRLVSPRIADSTLLSWNGVNFQETVFRGDVSGALCFSRLVFRINTWTK